MSRFTITTRFKLIIVLLALVVVLSIGGSVVVANLFLGGGGAAGNINLQKGLVGHWDFGAGSTTAATPDRTPNNNDCTVTGATLTTDRKGQSNKAYSFDGLNDFLGCGTSTTLDLTNVGTVAAWVYITAYPGAGKYPGIVSKGSQHGWDTPGYAIWINGDAGGAVKAIIVNPSPTRNEISWGNLATGTWWHLVFAWDGSNLNIYKNGASAATPVAQTLNANPVGLAFEIARATAGAHYANVTVDDVRIYNRALTAAEVTALYNSYDPGAVVSDLQKGLIGHWKFNSTAQDSSPYGNDGSLNGNAAITANDRKSQANKAATFDGTGDYVNLGDPASGIFDFGANQDFSYSLWIKSPASPATNFILAKGAGDTADVGYAFIMAGVGTTPQLTLSKAGEGSRLTIQGTAISDTNWHHIAMVHDRDGNGVIYQDGVQANSSDISTYNVSLANAQNLIVGCSSASTLCFTGQIDDLRIYNRALSAAEVTALYNSYDPSVAVSTLQKGLIGWWNFDSTAQDSTPYNKDGTVTGATLTTDRRSASNKAYSFDGTDDVIDMGATHVVANGDTRSFAFWVNPSDNGVYDFILGKSNGCGNYGQYTIRSAAGGVSFNYVNDAATITDYTGPAATVGTWSHYVITYTFGTGSSMAMYKNGVLASGSWDADAGNLVVTGTYLGNLNLGKFGTCTGADYHFAGSIDDVRIYNRALSAAEVLALYESYR